MSEVKRILVEGRQTELVLSVRPDKLLMATRNQFGLDVLNILHGLGFAPRLLLPNGMARVDTPEKIMKRDWQISYYDPNEAQDPNLYAIYTQLGETVGYMELLRQIRRPQGEGYSLFFRY